MWEMNVFILKKDVKVKTNIAPHRKIHADLYRFQI